MNKCGVCGEFKKVRKERLLSPPYLKSDIFAESEFGGFVHLIRYICEDCDKLEKILIRKSILKGKSKRLKEQKELIKYRDKLLGESLK